MSTNSNNAQNDGDIQDLYDTNENQADFFTFLTHTVDSSNIDKNDPHYDEKIQKHLGPFYPFYYLYINF